MKKHRAATLKRLSEMRKGSGNPFFGKHHTPEVKAKMIARLKWFRENRTYDIAPVTLDLPEGPLSAYVAGLVDGEGSIHFKKGQPAIYIYNTCHELMLFLKKRIGGSILTRGGRHRMNARCKTCYVWSVGGARNCAALLKCMDSWLIIKRKECDGMIKSLNDKYGDRLWQREQT